MTPDTPCPRVQSGLCVDPGRRPKYSGGLGWTWVGVGLGLGLWAPGAAVGRGDLRPAVALYCVICAPFLP